MVSDGDMTERLVESIVEISAGVLGGESSKLHFYRFLYVSIGDESTLPFKPHSNTWQGRLCSGQ